jgi:hypothetical protein
VGSRRGQCGRDNESDLYLGVPRDSAVMPAPPGRAGVRGGSTRRYHSVRQAGALGRTAEPGRPNGPRGACGAIEQGDAADEAQGGTRTSIQGAALCPRRADGRGHRFAADRQCWADFEGAMRRTGVQWQRGSYLALCLAVCGGSCRRKADLPIPVVPRETRALFEPAQIDTSLPPVPPAESCVPSVPATLQKDRVELSLVFHTAGGLGDCELVRVLQVTLRTPQILGLESPPGWVHGIPVRDRGEWRLYWWTRDASHPKILRGFAVRTRGPVSLGWSTVYLADGGLSSTDDFGQE